MAVNGQKPAIFKRLDEDARYYLYPSGRQASKKQREEFCERNYSFIDYITAVNLKRIPSYADPDLIRTAVHLGFTESMNRFDPGKGRFSRYATVVVNGRIKSILRDEDPLSRSQRKKIKMIASHQKDLESRAGAPVTDAEIIVSCYGEMGK
ncbi:MAG: hypothetical protein AABX86_01400, partial [Nanoarchaeota archaeon]